MLLQKTYINSNARECLLFTSTTAHISAAVPEDTLRRTIQVEESTVRLAVSAVGRIWNVKHSLRLVFHWSTEHCPTLWSSSPLCLPHTEHGEFTVFCLVYRRANMETTRTQENRSEKATARDFRYGVAAILILYVSLSRYSITRG